MSAEEDRVLADLSLKSVAEYLESDVCRNNVFIMVNTLDILCAFVRPFHIISAGQECFPINLTSDLYQPVS